MSAVRAFVVVLLLLFIVEEWEFPIHFPFHIYGQSSIVIRGRVLMVLYTRDIVLVVTCYSCLWIACRSTSIIYYWQSNNINRRRHRYSLHCQWWWRRQIFSIIILYLWYFSVSFHLNSVCKCKQTHTHIHTYMELNAITKRITDAFYIVYAFKCGSTWIDT